MRVFEIRDAFGIDNLKLAARQEAALQPGQARVQVRATSLNYRDLMTVQHGGARGVQVPLIPLSDGAGEVIEVGPEVSRVKPGDRVMGIFMQTWLAGEPTQAHAQSALGGAIDGMLAEQVVLHEDGLVHVPDYLSYEEAATLPCAAVTAWQGLMTQGGMQAGDTILVLGTGGVSIFALQFAAMAGAKTIITSSSDAKLERAKQLGAAECINYKATPDWEQRVLELTDGVGVDHVVEVGGVGTLEKSLQAVRIGGTVSLIGVLTGSRHHGPHGHPAQEHPHAGHLRRLAGHVRGHEPGDVAAHRAAGDRPRLSVRGIARGPVLHGKRRPFRQDRGDAVKGTSDGASLIRPASAPAPPGWRPDGRESRPAEFPRTCGLSPRQSRKSATGRGARWATAAPVPAACGC